MGPFYHSFFCLANAEVIISNTAESDTAIIQNIIIFLVLGSSIGISSIIFLTRKLKFLKKLTISK